MEEKPILMAATQCRFFLLHKTVYGIFENNFPNVRCNFNDRLK